MMRHIVLPSDDGIGCLRVESVPAPAAAARGRVLVSVRAWCVWKQ